MGYIQHNPCLVVFAVLEREDAWDNDEDGEADRLPQKVWAWIHHGSHLEFQTSYGLGRQCMRAACAANVALQAARVELQLLKGSLRMWCLSGLYLQPAEVDPIEVHGPSAVSTEIARKKKDRPDDSEVDPFAAGLERASTEKQINAARKRAARAKAKRQRAKAADKASGSAEAKGPDGAPGTDDADAKGDSESSASAEAGDTDTSGLDSDGPDSKNS